MATTPTGENPAGLEPFDYRHVAHLPEYRRMGEAIDEFVKALHREEIPFPQERLLAAVADAASALSFMDCCNECADYPATLPYAAERSGEGISASYRCKADHTWTCWWSFSAPDAI